MWRVYIETFICNKSNLPLETSRYATNVCSLDADNGLNADESQWEMNSVSLDGSLGEINFAER